MIEVPLGPVGTDDTISILPAYRLQAGGAVTEDGGGALVDFRIVQGHEETAVGSGVFTGRYYLNWEDSEQGGDFDNDAWGTISYELNVANNTIEITTNAVTQRGGGRSQLFGFITSGTTQDGFHAFSGVLGATFTDTTPVDTLAPDNGGQVPGCTNCRAGSEGGGQTGPQSYTFRIDPTADVADSLEPPLYYAAKFGSFNDENEDGVPHADGDIEDRGEYDIIDNFTGAIGADGVPDGYFAATSPQALITAIGNALSSVLVAGQNSASAPAFPISVESGGGLVVQSLFFETLESPADTDVVIDWVGEVQSLFVDQNGSFRQDNNGNGQLDDSDNVVQFETTPTGVVLNTFNLSDGSLVEGNLPLSDLQPVWSASDVLSSFSANSILTNRDYTDAANNDASRHIFTWIDNDGDGVSDSNEVIDYVSANVGGAPGTIENSFQSYLGFSGAAGGLTNEAQNVVNYVRGQDDIEGFRSRTIEEEDGTVLVKRLGDIVGSSPVLVSAPSESFDLDFFDSTYADFRETYANRRNVVYVGGNDGLLHAFNAGFESSSEASSLIFSENSIGGTATAHELGAELWAYAPLNLLPHHQWLTDPNYRHVFYMDGNPEVFDVNIFDPDDTHPNGWGTILVVGMGLGGGDFNLGFDNGDANNEDEVTRSSYVIFDITDPEQKPVLLGEISHPDLNHTTSNITVVKNRVASTPGNFIGGTSSNTWSLVFGSGPDNRNDFTSSTSAKIFSLDLTLNGNGVIAQTEPDAFDTLTVSPSIEPGYVGGMVTTDWDPDFVDDVVYFGTAQRGASIQNETGALFRFLPGLGEVNVILDLQRPITSEPIAETVQGQNFVYIGSGRYEDLSEAETTEQEIYVGIREQEADFTITFELGNLLDTTDIEIVTVFDTEGVDDVNTADLEILRIEARGGTSGQASEVDPNGDDSITTFDELSQFILDGGDDSTTVDGWLLNLNVGGSSERVVSNSDTLNSILAFEAFTPEESICEPEFGSVRTFVRDLTTGTATSFAAIGTIVIDPDSGEAINIGETDPVSGIGNGVNLLNTAPDEDGGNNGILTTETNDTSLGNKGVITGEPIGIQRINWREIVQ